jgi:hypothetical protein
MKKRTRRFLGIVGMMIAILGGIAWFANQIMPAIILWGIAAFLVIKLNKKKAQN